MKNKIKEMLIKLYNWKLLILAVLVISGAFYWYEIRPSKIYSSCVKKSLEIAGDGSNVNTDDLELYYRLCIRNKGLNK